MAGIFLILDGMTDERFQMSQLPNLHRLAGEQAHGLFQTTPAGLQAETVTCVLTLLDMEAELVARTGRGWLEALGAGINFSPQDLLCKASWLRVDAAGRAVALAEAPKLPQDARYRPLGAYRALLLLPGQAASLAELRTKPPHQHLGQPLTALLPEGCPALLELCQSYRQPGLALIPWGQAVPGELPSRSGLVISAVEGVRGIARACGMCLLDVPGASGDVDTDLLAKAEAALVAAARGEDVLLHINGADEAAHRQDGGQKQHFLRCVDAQVLPRLIASGLPLLICGDHGSSPWQGCHLAQPQPFVLAHHGLCGDLGLLPGGMAYRYWKGEC